MSDTAQLLSMRYPLLEPGRPHTIWHVLQTGRTRFDPAVDRRRFVAEARDDTHLRLLEALGYGGEVVVPLRARGRSLGAITFVRGESSPPFAVADRRLAEELTGRVALALDNARLLAQSQASEARYRELFEGVADAILVLDPSGLVQEVNSSGCSLLRSERGELVGRRIGDIPGLEVLEADLLAIAGSNQVAEFTIESGEGAPAIVEARAGEVRLPSGTIYLAVLRDVSARQALDRLRRDFLAMVTHDLRSPLAALRAQAQLMQRRGEYNEQRTTAIIGQTDRMARLIDGLADVMRMDAGQLELRRGRVDLRDVVRAAIAQEVARAPERAVVFEAPQPVLGEWDADRLFQVITNLVGNALNYSDPDTDVTVRVSQTERDAVAEVRDRGQGIAPEHLGKLFDRFFRAEVTGAGGLGLGLFIARLLVEAHGGTIAVQSVVGTGTTFTVRLPKVLDAVT